MFCISYFINSFWSSKENTKRDNYWIWMPALQLKEWMIWNTFMTNLHIWCTMILWWRENRDYWIQFLHCVFSTWVDSLTNTTNDVFLIDREQGNLLEEWSCCFNGNFYLLYTWLFFSFLRPTYSFVVA